MSIVEKFHICNCYMNRKVRVHMRNGEVHEGFVMGVDREHVYLRPHNTCGNNRNRCRISLFFGAGAAITTLALFDLLAIALIV